MHVVPAKTHRRWVLVFPTLEIPMSRLILTLLLIAHSTISLAENLVIEPKHASFAPAVTSSVIKQGYTISNRGATPVAIRDWKAISGVGEVVGLPKVLQAGESRSFEVRLTVPANVGSSGFRYALFTDESDVERYRFTLSGFAYSLITPEQAAVDFGTRAVATGQNRQITFSARESTPLKLTSVQSAPAWLQVEIQDQTATLTIKQQPQAGFRMDKVQIGTNLPQQPMVEINVRAVLAGVLSSNIYAMGFKPTEVGQSVNADVEIRYSGTSNIGKLEIELPEHWTSRRSACDPKSADARPCLRVHVSLKVTEKGSSTGNLVFRMPGEGELAIPYGLMVLGEGQPVRELVVGDATADEKIDITRAVTGDREPSAPPPDQAPEGNAATTRVARSSGPGPVKLHWTAKNETKVFGYMVYRSQDRAGPFVRVTDAPIAKRANAADQDNRYEFVDAGVEVGKTYYYYIDSLADSGMQQRFSPVFSKTITGGKQ